MSEIRYQLGKLLPSLVAEARGEADSEIKSRFYLLKAVVKSKKSVKEVCESRGESTDSFYKWAKRLLKAKSLYALKPKSRRPKKSPTKTSSRIEKRILKLRRAEPYNGPDVISHDLKLLFNIKCPPSTVHNVLKRRNQPPVDIQILSSLSTIFTLVTALGIVGYFGRFGVGFDAFHDFVFLSLLAFSCGAQNAMFTNYSSSVIRTTHLTGLTTDLGIGIAKRFVAGDEDEKKFNKVRTDLILSFLAGSILAAFVFPIFEYWGFLLPAVLSLAIGLRLYSTRD